MEPISLAAAIISIIGTIVTLGTRTYGLYDGITSAVEEFNVFSREIANFSSLWGLVQPYVDDPNSVISPTCIATLAKVRDDVIVIFQDVERLLKIFLKEDKACLRAGPWNNYHNALFANLEKVRNDRAKRIQKFFKHTKVALLRSQLLHALVMINAVFSMIHLPAPGSNGKSFRQSAEFIVEQLINSQRRLERVENEIAHLSVRGTTWMAKLPDLTRARNPVDALHSRWVTTPAPTPQALGSLASISMESMPQPSHRLENTLRNRIKFLENLVAKQSRKLMDLTFKAQNVNKIAQEAAMWKNVAQKESNSHVAVAASHRQLANELKKSQQENEDIRSNLDMLGESYNAAIADNRQLKAENARLKGQPAKCKRRLEELRFDRDDLQVLCDQQQQMIEAQNTSLYLAISRIRKISHSMSSGWVSRTRARHRLDRLRFALEDLAEGRTAEPSGRRRFWRYR